jgi:malate dehydrogenase (oxaloacetate-decarboxylating)
MVLAAAYALAEYVAERHLSSGHVYPPVEEMREVSRHVATRVIEQAFQDGVARTTKFTAPGAATHVRAKMWTPRYLPFVGGKG